MDSWKELRVDAALDWLLEEENPSVKYLTLRDLLDRPENDKELQNAKKDIMLKGSVPAILESMRAQDYQTSVLPRFYLAKYTGLVWQLIILAELEADGGNEEINAYCEYLIEHSQERESGGFSIEASAKLGGGRKSTVIPCLTGNMIWSLSKLGKADDPRVVKAREWLAKIQCYDDGDGAPSGWPYDKMEMCWGKHACHMGVVKALKAFSEVPQDKRTDSVNSSIELGAEYLLKHHIFKQSHDLAKVSKPGWKRLSFPLMYQTDVLEILLILGRLGVRDGRMQEAVDIIISKRDAKGRWAMDKDFESSHLIDIEGKGQSKWITLRALKALKAYYPG